MTGIEWGLLLIGSIFLIGSFFVAERLSSSELSQVAELSEDELKKIIGRELANAEERTRHMIDEQIEASIDKVDRALGRETNEKIMAISEYSDTVIENMNKTHNEIMFLYSMLNDKHTELTGMVSDLQRLAADIRDIEESHAAAEKGRHVSKENPASKKKNARGTSAASASLEMEAAAVRDALAEPPGSAGGRAKRSQKAAGQEQERAAKILKMHSEGVSDIGIAQSMGMGVGEVRLIIGLHRGE